MGKQMRTLLPAAASKHGFTILSSPHLQTLQPKRRNIAVACEHCRQKKAKCNGDRPACSRCVSLEIKCRYEVEGDGVTRHAAVKAKNSQLLEENTQLKELFNLLRQKSEIEAAEILSRIRASETPFAVLKFVKEADLLLPSPAAASSKSLCKIDFDALGRSAIVVPAHPWTAVAGDGLVSELITSFFNWDDAFFYPFLDQECFLEDMRSRAPQTAKFCSPFLVNAICAVRCYTSDSVKAVLAVTGLDLKQQFLDEAKRLLEMENGRASLPTVQGLALLFTVSAYMGTDRAGSIYRYLACTTLKSMKLEKKVARLKDDDASEAREKRAICKALWGLFCFESIVAYVYIQPSLLPPPTVPRPVGYIAEDASCGNLDILGRPFHLESPGPPRVPGAFEAICDLSEFLYEVMVHNANDSTEPGSEEDLKVRRDQFARLEAFENAFPERLHSRNNFTPQTCFLRVYLDVIAISILRLLHPRLVFKDRTVSVKDLLIRHCAFDIEVIDRYHQLWPLKEYSCMFLCGAYGTAMTLVPLLHDVRTHAMFTKACYFLRCTAKDFPMARYIMQGLLAVAWSLKLSLPEQAKVFFERLGLEKEDLKDVPVGFIIPQYAEVSEVLSDDGRDSREIGGQLGVLLSKWSALSL